MLIKRLCTSYVVYSQIWLNVSYGWLLLKAMFQIWLKNTNGELRKYHKPTNSAQLTVCISSLLFEGRAREKSSSWDPLFLFIPSNNGIHACKSLHKWCSVSSCNGFYPFVSKPKKKEKKGLCKFNKFCH